VRDLNRDAEVVSTSPARPRSVVVKSNNGVPLRRNVTNLVPLQNTELSETIMSLNNLVLVEILNLNRFWICK